jgi:hypothetical protein
MIPFDLGSFECTVNFHDPKIGEFLAKIEASVSQPHASDTLQWSCRAATSTKKSLRITHSNGFRDRALYTASQLSSAKPPLPNGVEKSSADINSGMFRIPKMPLRYQISYSSQIFFGPSEITLKPPRDVQRDDGTPVAGMDQAQTDLPIVFTPPV